MPFASSVQSTREQLAGNSQAICNEFGAICNEFAGNPAYFMIIFIYMLTTYRLVMYICFQHIKALDMLTVAGEQHGLRMDST